MAGHIPDGQAEPPIAELDHVIPVAAHRPLLCGGDVPRRHAEAGQSRQSGRQQAPLQRLGDLPLYGEPGPLDRKRHPVGHQLQQLDVGIREVTLGQAPDVEDAGHPSLDDQRDPEERTDLLFAHQGVDHRDRGVVEIRDDHRLARRGHSAGEATADGQPESPLDLLLEALGRPGRERPPVILDEQHRGCVRIEDVRDPLEQLREQVVQVEVGEGRLGDALDVLEPWDPLLGGGRLRGDFVLVGGLWRHPPEAPRFAGIGSGSGDRGARLAAPPTDQLRPQRAGDLDLTIVVDQHSAVLGEQWAPEVRTAEQGCLGESLGLEGGPAKCGDADQPCPGRPASARIEQVMGETAVPEPPEANVESRCRNAPDRDVENRRRLVIDRVTCVDRNGIEVRSEPPDPDVPAAIHDEARVAAQVRGDEVGCAGPCRSRPCRRPPPEGAGSCQPRRRPANWPHSASRRGRAGRRSGAAASASASGSGATPRTGLAVPGGHDRPAQGRIDQTAAPLRRPEPRLDRLAEQRRGRNRLARVLVESGQLAVGLEAGEGRVEALDEQPFSLRRLPGRAASPGADRRSAA